MDMLKFILYRDDIVLKLEEAAEQISSNPCTFWACPGPFNQKGKIRRKTQAMLTCTNCRTVIEINNLFIRMQDRPLKFKNLFPIKENSAG